MNETARPNPEELREIGETSTNVANSWAGAENYLSQGLVHWLRRQLSSDQKAAVKAALAACRLVVEKYPTDGADAQAPKQYIDDMLAKTQRWVDNPSNNNKEAVRSSLDTTRSLHAWPAGICRSRRQRSCDRVPGSHRTACAYRARRASASAAAPDRRGGRSAL